MTEPSRVSLQSLPGWSREIEEYRLTKTNLRVADISQLAGRSASWWTLVKTNVRAPKNWVLIRNKILKGIKNHG